MEKRKKRAEKLITQTVSALIDKEAKQWPPTCMGFIYQSMRPYSKCEHSDATTSHKST